MQFVFWLDVLNTEYLATRRFSTDFGPDPTTSIFDVSTMCSCVFYPEYLTFTALNKLQAFSLSFT